jgi:hypothetical protein
MLRPGPEKEARGATLLLRHCDALDERSPGARRRLERELGDDLTRLLVRALTAAVQGRPA